MIASNCIQAEITKQYIAMGAIAGLLKYLEHIQGIFMAPKAVQVKLFCIAFYLMLNVDYGTSRYEKYANECCDNQNTRVGRVESSKRKN